MNALEHFRHHLHQPDVSAEVLALDIAQIGRTAFDPAESLAELDRLADYVDLHLDAGLSGRAAAARFLEILTHDLAFHGNRADYYDPRNSFLDQVLERRTGLPIMLALVSMAIGRRLGLRIDGIGFPHHFMARYTDAEGAWLLDPFRDAVVEIAHAETHLAAVVGRPVTLAPAAFTPVTAHELAARILNNLRAAYVTHPQAEKLLSVLAFQTVLTPRSVSLWRERAVLRYHLQAWEEAAHDLRHYFALLGALPYLFPESARAVYTLPELAPDDRNLLVMHRRISEVLNRLN
jgi:regulator of sirC expression with transglutaminase-like and TPR domain